MTITSAHALDVELLPDERTWGPGFGSDRPYPAETLAEIAGYIAETRQPGYGDRLHSTSAGYVPGGDRAQVPPGFDARHHPNRAGGSPESMDPEIPTSLGSDPVQVDTGVQEYSRSRGWLLDQHGRPMHPHHTQLLADDRIGLPVGLGFSYFWGEATVADSVVTAAGQVLLVPRATDQGVIPALPGGYALPSDEGRSVAQWRAGDRAVTREGILTTAARKLRDETGFEVPRDVSPRLVRAIRPVSSPHTLNAWTCTYTVHVNLGDGPAPAVNEAAGAYWVTVDQLYDDVLPRMWPDHRRAVLAAIE
ncbi:NUDIX domain-containing protein [Amycolatopsis keratiniphila]|uniref:Nudix hydrolase domain-containing protein n=1 Tax=Amycolatopsis keratiniphila subsp. keratiniphila TaxID=227715 RepID=A0A1W2M2S9_9PSEU|nr:NUDIX domain-containing protein [Amycolatopsis keratiniphila]ONF73964.1 hypothetical protein AVR91_0204335 [Amycolatopsis keratiniphila subsp. keratiniphila]